MSLGDARIDISANLAPLREGIDRARAEVTSFVASTKRKIATPRSLRGLGGGKQKAIEVRANVKPLINSMKKATAAVSNMVGAAKSKFMTLRSAVKARSAEMEKEFSAKIKKMTDSVKKSTLTIIASFTSIKAFALSASRAIPAIGRAAIKTATILKTVLNPAINVITSGLRKMVGVAKIAAFSFVGIIAASVKIRATFEETSNLFRVALGGMAEAGEEWVKRYSASLGLYEGNTKKALGTFVLMTKSMGLTEEAAFDMSKQLVRAAVDISSLRNIGFASALEKVRSALVGMSRPLQDLGILTDEETLKEIALADASFMAARATKKQGVELTKIGNLYVNVTKKTKGMGISLTQLEKLQLRFKAILKGSKDDVDDLSNTLDSTTNVFKIIGEQVKRTGDTIGKEFIGDITKAGIVVREWLKNNQAFFSKWAKSANDSVGAVITKLQEYFSLAKQGNFEAIFTDLGRIFSTMLEGINAAFQKMRPVAVDLGTAIADGFIAAIKKTKLGKFLTETTAKTKSLGGQFIDESVKQGRFITGVAGMAQIGEGLADRFGPKPPEPVQARVGAPRGPVPPEPISMSRLNITPRTRIPQRAMQPTPTDTRQQRAFSELSVGEKILLQLQLQTKMLIEGNRGI